MNLETHELQERWLCFLSSKACGSAFFWLCREEFCHLEFCNSLGAHGNLVATLSSSCIMSSVLMSAEQINAPAPCQTLVEELGGVEDLAQLSISAQLHPSAF